MTERVVTIWADAPLERAQERMAEARFSALPVVDRAFALVGVISLVDVLRHRDHADATVGDAMTADVVSVLPTTAASIVAHRMRVYGELRLVPVVQRGRLLGVITRSDLLRARTTPGVFRRAARRLGGARVPGAMPEAVLPRGAGRLGGRPISTLKVSDVMTDGGLVAIPPELTLDEAAEVLLSYRFTSVPVVDERDRLLGVVSEADLMAGSIEGGRRLKASTVAGVMTRDVEIVHPGDPLTAADHLLTRRKFRVVPVLDGDDVLVGIVSRSDLL